MLQLPIQVKLEHAGLPINSMTTDFLFQVHVKCLNRLDLPNGEGRSRPLPWKGLT